MSEYKSYICNHCGGLFSSKEYKGFDCPKCETGKWEQIPEKLRDLLSALFDARACEITRLQSELQQERESHRWIPVEERLPEDGERVNLFDGATGFFIYGEKDTYTDDGRWLWKTDFGAWHKENVTHWQPLPSSPEKDKE